ncbi:flagellar basal-body rod protein FlgF [Elstera cyanobacteriorum]|uniref:Flagellar basal-body rod protein FlgF n=1 Tax=Elstera cyanobacteriorum TaxID=2022747 RepID=A0A255XPH1_9PROT|nr:flagellar basal-body rod protein FlgF [Elstera cyanobacteriorum]MCK6442169.1 flagellar basal-body rod protein FlgF [Elstera cyanobacteriorum]OYQ18802.1 flagellar basal-body rod protein FlgF [Elstera cyanobacteriorum]GFZ77603.1 flagellar basal-body rod protein FlgF [Elstera cyanobacteriorum]
MESPIQIALSRQTALRRSLDSTANNIANASTSGYRREQTLFQEYLARTGTPGNRQMVSYTQDIGTFRDFSEGTLSSTGNPLDVALRGDAFFTVGHPAQNMYTRNGVFHLDANGQIVTADGYPILAENGQPISVPQNERGQILIDSQGTVSFTTQNGIQDLGRLALVRFNDQQAMRPAGSSMYATDQEALPAPETVVAQGYIESSNVKPVLEVTQMLEIMRDYQSLQKLIDAEGDRQTSAITKIAKQT